MNKQFQGRPVEVRYAANLRDMAGNAAEWVADEIELDANNRMVGYPPASEADPKPRRGAGGYHIARGGSFLDAPMWLRAAARGDATEGAMFFTRPFRSADTGIISPTPIQRSIWTRIP